MSESTTKVDRAGLSPLRQALLAKRLKAISAAAAAPKIQRRPDARRAPLSFEQEQLWRLAEQEGGLSYYARGFRIAGALDAAVLERAVGELVRRHEALRTTFSRAGGEVAQFINPSAPGVFSSVAADGADEGHVQRLVEEEARKPFDLGADSLLRVTLFRLGEDEHVLLLVVPHLISDRWSLNLLVEELLALCDAFSRRQPSPLRPPPLQYGDYAHWQRNEWRPDEAGLAFWRRLLADAPARLDLPADYAPAAHERTGRNGRLAVELGAEAAEAVRAMAKAEGATLFMACLAAFSVVLHRFTGSGDIVVSSGVAGRGRTELEGLVGCLSKFPAYRARVSGGMTFSELLRQVREVALEVYAHQDAPLELALGESAAGRGWASPRRNVGFVLHQAARERNSFALRGLELKTVRLDSDRARTDLMARAGDTGRELSLSMEYDADLFAPETIARLLAQFRRVLEAAAADPQVRLDGLLDAPPQ